MIGIAGCGALGSHIATFIAEPEMKMGLFDFDRVDKQNVLTGTSVFSREHIGTFKSDTLAGILFTRFGASVRTHRRPVDSDRLFLACSLVIDCFDNAEARSHTVGLDIPALHVGVSPQMIGAIEWDETYQLPDAIEPEPNEICTHQLGRDIILLTSVVASTIIRRFLVDGTKLSAVVNNRLEIIR
jgi:hypothetical protein